MKRTLLTLAAATTLALTACGGPTAAPEPTSAPVSAEVATEPAEATPAPTKEAPTEMPADDYTTDNPDDYDVGPGDDDQPMTAEELEGDDEPMDGDHEPENGYMTEEEAQTEYDQCIADNLGEELCQGAYEFNTMTKDEAQDLGDVINSPGYKCLADLQETRPDLWDGEWFVDVINETPEVLEDPDVAACAELNENL